MKQNLRTVGEVEIDEHEAALVMLEYLKTERKLLDAFNQFLQKEKGYSATRIAHNIGKEGLTVVVEVKSSTAESPRTLFKSEKSAEPGEKRQPSGFKRTNVGFFKELVAYLTEEKKKKRKDIPFDEAYEDMKFLFPTLTERNFMIYASDKRQQQAKGFKFDGKKRLFLL